MRWLTRCLIDEVVNKMVITMIITISEPPH